MIDAGQMKYLLVVCDVAFGSTAAVVVSKSDVASSPDSRHRVVHRAVRLRGQDRTSGNDMVGNAAKESVHRY
jgi:hypothetical protein